MNDIEILERLEEMQQTFIEEGLQGYEMAIVTAKNLINSLIKENTELRIQISARETVVDELEKENKELKEENNKLKTCDGILDVFSLGKESSRQRIKYDWVEKDKIKEIIYPTPENYIPLEVQQSDMYKKLESLLEGRKIYGSEF